MRFDFLRPVRAFSAFLNYVPPCYGPEWGRPTLRAFDAAGALLGAFDLDALAPVRTPGATNAGAWRGVAFGDAAIAAVEVGDGAFVLDDATFRMDAADPAPPPTVTPEPGALALAAGGVGALAAARRRADARRPRA